MGALGDLLELLHFAGPGDRAVRVVAERWVDHDQRHELLRPDEADPPWVVDDLGVVSEGARPATGQTTNRVRLWLAPGGRMREEDDDLVVVRRGPRWWLLHRDEHAASGVDGDEEGPGSELVRTLLLPGRFLGALALEPAGEALVAGRPALLVRAPLRGDLREGDDWPVHDLAHGADEFRLAVDRATGFLLRVEALREGVAFQRVEVLELELAGDWDDGTFEPPDGSGTVVGDPRPLSLEHLRSPGAAAGRVPFALWEAEPVWEGDVHHLVEEVDGTLVVRSEWTAERSIARWTLTQQAAGTPAGEASAALSYAEHGPWEAAVRGPLVVDVRRPRCHWHPSQARCRRGGTLLAASSGELDADALADVLAGLRPAAA